MCACGVSMESFWPFYLPYADTNNSGNIDRKDFELVAEVSAREGRVWRPASSRRRRRRSGVDRSCVFYDYAVVILFFFLFLFVCRKPAPDAASARPTAKVPSFSRACSTFGTVSDRPTPTATTRSVSSSSSSSSSLFCFCC